MASINFNVQNNSIDDQSVVILRTNPVLSSNVKLVVNSDGNIYLDSISANRTLSDQRYKKFELDQFGSYSLDLAKFYSETPLDAAFEVYRTNSDTSVYREYERQYEEQYQYGARLNESKLYDDNIRFMAPLWLEKQLPEYFVVYRIDEPVPTGSVNDDSLNSINSKIMQMLESAKIVKVFDLRKGSKIGNYLDSHVNNPLFPVSPITVSFDDQEKTTWNGIDLVKGGFTQKGEYIHRDFVQTDRQEILNNQFITEGYKRNKMVCANLINMEFIFNDDTVDAYDVNRYIGIYVTAHTEGSFKSVRYYKNSLKIDLSTVQTTYNLTGTGLAASAMLPKTDLDKPVLQWVKERDAFYHICNSTNPSATVLDELKVIGMSGANIGGMVKKRETLEIESVIPAAKDFWKIRFIDAPANGERFALAAKSEWTLVNDENAFSVTADSALAAGQFNELSFSNQGSLEQIAYAFSRALLNIQDNPFEVVYNGTAEIVIYNNSIGNRTYRSFFAIYATNSINSIEILNGISDNAAQLLAMPSSVYADWDLYAPSGGSNAGVGFLVKESETGDIDNQTYILDRNKFIRIVEIVQDPANTSLYRVCLEKAGSIELTYAKSFNLYIESRIEFGKFAALDFYDFDFNFFSTDNSQLHDLNFEVEANYDTGARDAQIEDLVEYNTAPDVYFPTLQTVRQAASPTFTPNTNITNEYDRLQENYLKETSTLSRVVPFINKWAYKNAKNTRDLPYILTVSEAFGKTNFAPDLDVSGRLATGLTHDWYYLYRLPSYTNVVPFDSGDPTAVEILQSLHNYVQPSEAIQIGANDFISVTEDWFNRIFVYEGAATVDQFVRAPFSKKYGRFIKGDTTGTAEVMFRGLKVKAYARKEFNEANPRNLVNTSEFNGYKFSALVVFNGGQASDTVDFKVIQNKKWGVMTLLIEVNTSDENLSFLNRKLLYSVKDFMDSSGNYTTTQLSGYIKMKGSGICTGVNTRLVSQVQVNAGGGYGSIKFTYGGDTWVAPVVNVLSENQLEIEVNGSGQIRNEANTANLTLNSIADSVWANTAFVYDGGGYNLGRVLFEQLSARNIVELFNSNDTERIQYITVETDGTQLNNRFILNIEDGNTIIKPSFLIPQSDPIKPQSYKVSSGLIGYVNTFRADPYVATLVRMNGEYEPLKKPVVTFTDLYRGFKVLGVGSLSAAEKRQKLIYERFNRMGIAFASFESEGFDRWGLIKDMFFHKINPEKADGILKLSVTSGNQPVYPLIAEVAIDKRDYNVFRSSWEDKFYVKNDTQFVRQFVFGTLSAHEESAFMASTLNLPKATYDITSFNNPSEVASLEAMKQIKDANNFQGDYVIYENDNDIYVDFYLKNNLIEKLIDDGAGISINKYVNASESYGDKTSLLDDTKQYVEVNLLKLMGIGEVRVWSQRSKSIAVSEVLNANNLNAILDSTFEEDKSFRLQYDPVRPLNVRLIYTKRPGFKHQLYVYVKINS